MLPAWKKMVIQNIPADSYIHPPVFLHRSAMQMTLIWDGVTTKLHDPLWSTGLFFRRKSFVMVYRDTGTHMGWLVFSFIVVCLVKLIPHVYWFLYFFKFYGTSKMYTVNTFIDNCVIFITISHKICLDNLFMGGSYKRQLGNIEILFPKLINTYSFVVSLHWTWI